MSAVLWEWSDICPCNRGMYRSLFCVSQGRHDLRRDPDDHWNSEADYLRICHRLSAESNCKSSRQIPLPAAGEEAEKEEDGRQTFQRNWNLPGSACFIRNYYYSVEYADS